MEFPQTMVLGSTCMLCGIFLDVRVLFFGKQSLSDLAFSDFDSQQVKAGVTPASVASDARRVLARTMLSLRWAKRKSQLALAISCFWCPEEDSNLHTLRHTDLNRARLPIPPSGQCNLLKARNLIVKGQFVNEKEK
jgi:hypothetical protein